MTYRYIKYGLLTALFIVTLYQVIPFGDYCSGLVQVITFILFGGLFLLSFLIFTFVDLYRLKKAQKKFDFIHLLFLGFFLLINYISLVSDGQKFWTDKICTGQVQGQGDLHASQIRLYSNNTFSVTISYVNWSCTYQGSYEIKNDILVLKRKEIPKLTDSVFNDTYKIDFKDSLLIPINKRFEKIEIKCWAQKK